jgi:hypothetical protein
MFRSYSDRGASTYTIPLPSSVRQIPGPIGPSGNLGVAGSPGVAGPTGPDGFLC